MPNENRCQQKTTYKHMLHLCCQNKTLHKFKEIHVFCNYYTLSSSFAIIKGKSFPWTWFWFNKAPFKVRGLNNYPIMLILLPRRVLDGDDLRSIREP